MISQRYKEQMQQMHRDRTDFGANGKKWLPAVLDIAGEGDTILDYGCGRGSLKQAISSKFDVREYDPGIPGKDQKPEPADIVVCTDVAEHIEPEYLNDFINDLLRVTKKKLLLNVATRPAAKTLPDGRNAHLIQQPFQWWYPKLTEHFVTVKAHADQGEFTMLLQPRDEPLRVFIGYDHRQPAAYTVAATSLVEQASKPVQVMPLVLQTLPIVRSGLTPFTFSRFLVPWLCKYEGVGLFVDADVMFRGDVYEMLDHYQGDTVTVVKNTQLAPDPKKPEEVHMQAKPSLVVERRYEWPSVMLFNNAKCKQLTPEYVQHEKGILLLNWAESIGEMPEQWNHLVGYNDPNPKAKIVHYTQGLPCYPQTEKDEFADEWKQWATRAISFQSWETLMGASVHAEHVQARAA